MKRVLCLTLALTVALSLTIGIAAEGPGAAHSLSPTSGIDVNNLDRGVKPCEDFNRFANGGWIAKNPIPAEYSSWGTPQLLRERNVEQLRTILEAAAHSNAPKGSNERKIGDYYYSALDTKTRDAAGLKALAPWLARIDEIKDVKSLQSAFAYLATYNVDSPFGIGSSPDLKNSKQIIAGVDQSGISLPDRDYYLKDDDKSKTIREQYAKHVGKTFELMGEDPARAATSAKTVLEIETRLAGVSLTRIELRNPYATYHVMTAEERKAVTPNFDWDAYLEDCGLTASTPLNLAEPKFFKEVDAMLSSVPIASWQTYLRWRLVNFTSPMLSTPFEQENFDFYGRVLAGTKEQGPLWKRAVGATSSRLGEAVGEVYVKKYFPPGSKQRIKELVANLKAVLRDDIQHLDWMSDATRAHALAKLDT
ncbi:MAG TPA: M13 family metallopeptidase N-terminal domain-containing protein, partial [Blastocatellia bacterium]|nr:M13 family metallopeptidase N-terminal domain-containing protein [Blastocatellia bacterium]